MEAFRSSLVAAANSIAQNNAALGSQLGSILDFSLVFNQAIFTTLPNTLMIGACPIYIFWYHDQSFVTSKRSLLFIKLIFAFCLWAFERERAVAWQLLHNAASPPLTNIPMSTTILSNFYTVTLAISLYYDHLCARQSTAFLSIFLTISAMTEGVRVGQLLGHDAASDVTNLTVGCLVVKAFLIFVLEIPKPLDSHRYNERGNKTVGDDKTGFWGRVFAVCANSVVFRGFRNHLSMDDLADLAPDEFSKQMAIQFEPVWKDVDKELQYALFKACLWTMRWQILSALLCCAIRITCEYMIIFGMQMTLHHFRNSKDTSLTNSAVVGANVLIYTVLTVARSLFLHEVNRLALHLRGTLMGQIAKKAMDLTTHEAQRVGILNLMTSDVDIIVDSIQEMLELSLAVPGLVAGFYCLRRVVGNAFFTPALYIAIMVGTYAGAQTSRPMGLWSAGIQTRLARTAAMISQSTVIKALGLEDIIIRHLETLRSLEISLSMRVRELRVMVITALPLNYWFTPTVVFVAGVYWTVWKETGLDPVTPWVAFGFIDLIRIPMWYLLKSWGIGDSFLLGFARLQKFLLLTKMQDVRQLRQFGSQNQSSTKSDNFNKRVVKRTKTAAQIEENMLNRCISMTMVSVASSQPGSDILQNIDLYVPASKLTVVVGSAGCGKTVFLRTLLGETAATGTIEMSSFDIAYCAQNVWLPVGTIKSAIIAGAEFNTDRFNAIISACALTSDITTLGSLDTQVGLNGTNLSASQKQKIALARALYSPHHIVICDNPLTAMDSQTATDIFQAVFSDKGMLKQQGRSILLATHERTWVSSADQVIHLNNEGLATVHRGKDAIGSLLRSEDFFTSINPNSTTSKKSEELLSAVLEHARKDKEKSISILDSSLYRYIFKSISALRFIWAMLLIVFNGFVERSPNLFLFSWIERHPMNKSYATYMILLGFITMASTGYGAFVYYIQIIPAVARQTHAAFTNAAFGANVPFAVSTNNHIRANWINQDMITFGQEMPMALYNALHLTSILVTNIGMQMMGTGSSVVVFLTFLLATWILRKFYLLTWRQIRLLDLKAKALLYDAIDEILAGLEHIRAFGQQDHAMHSFYHCLDRSQRVFFTLQTTQRWLVLVTDVNATILIAALLSTTIRTRAVSPAGLGLAMLNMPNIGGLVRLVIERWARWEIFLGTAVRLRDFEQMASPQKDTPSVQIPATPWPTNGSVEFQSVTTSYVSSSGKMTTALERVSATFQAGQRVLITGGIGSGKSTMLFSMLNLVPFKGRIIIDNQDVAKMPRVKLRDTITIIPQSAPSIPGSMLECLLPSDIKDQCGLITDSIIQKVLEDVMIWDYIETNGGLETSFYEMHFSVEQKQLVSIARAILHQRQFKTKIVLIDEFAAHLSSETREAALSAMNIAFRGCTRVEISGSVRDAMECDVIFTLSNGWLVQTDIVDAVDDLVKREFPDSTAAAQLSTSPEARITGGAVPEGNTGQGPVPTQLQSASEGEKPTGTATCFNDSIDAEANKMSFINSNRHQQIQTSTAGASPGRSSNSKRVGFTTSATGSGFGSGYIVSPRAKTRRLKPHERQFSVRRTPFPSSSSVPQHRDTTELYRNRYLLHNGEIRTTFTLIREDLKFAQHQTPYITALPTEKEMIEENGDITEEERQQEIARRAEIWKAKVQARIDSALADDSVGELKNTVWDGVVALEDEIDAETIEKKGDKGKGVEICRVTAPIKEDE